MERGAHVWCDCEGGTEAWMLAEIVKRSATELTLKEKSGKSFTRKGYQTEEGEQKYQGVELANTPLSEEDIAEGLDENLINLPHLHEPAILHSVSERFMRDEIYTYTGPVCIAVNPFARLPNRTDAIIEMYRRDGLFTSQGMTTQGVPPHVFAIADKAYRAMMKPERQSQAILISGESGAGKTESTKIVMQYISKLGTAGQELNENSDEPNVVQKVLKSSEVLEAFGNARTLRNDNSSRFGKFIELGFNRSGQLIGAKIQTYLLEKVRLSFHASGERNYHIFYGILRGSSHEDKKKWMVDDIDTGGLDLPNFFHYTGQGGAPYMREYTDEEFHAISMSGMKGIGWSKEIIDGVLNICAGILHLGQIKFNNVVDPESGMEVAEVAELQPMEAAAELLGVDFGKFKRALTEKVVVARGTEIVTKLNHDKAGDARDSIAKTIYGSLFLWIVKQVNTSICWEDEKEMRSSVGVLDIFGFECFAINSFEQLCINFTNEALQQQFNKYIFKLEQEEYEREGIKWAFISFPDNQDCLDTIQKKKTGILSMLDEECKLGPRGSDTNFVKRMYKEYLPNKNQTESENTRFVASRIQQVKLIFCVRHFAGLVEYTAKTSFMDKNKDEIPLTAKDLFETAPNQLVRDTYEVQKAELADNAPDANKAKSPGKSKKSKTVGAQFKDQLNSLIRNVEKVGPHYIRCLKPNDAAKPRKVTRKRLTEQLRYGGVLEAVRVARAGYPVRLPHDQFYQKYRMILPHVPDQALPRNMDGENPEKMCMKLLDKMLSEGEKMIEATKKGPLDPNEKGITRAEKIRRMMPQPDKPLKFPKSDAQLGHTKLFLRKPPHDVLEAYRVFHQHASATIAQTWIRGLQKRRAFYTVQDAVHLIQRSYRGCKGRERYRRVQRETAGDLLTVNFRMIVVWRRFNLMKRGMITHQKCYRGYLCRKNLASVKIQARIRMFLKRHKYVKIKSATLALQCAVRERIAKKLMNELKREQKDVGKLKQNNEKLKLEMASLRAMLSAQAKQDGAKNAHNQELELKQEEITVLEKRVSVLEKELAKQEALVKSMKTDLERQKEQSVKDKTQIQSLSKMNREATLSPRKSIAVKNSVSVSMPVELPTLDVNSEILEEQMMKLENIEMELENEKNLRRDAEDEIVKLREAISSSAKLGKAELDKLVKNTEVPPREKAPVAPASAEKPKRQMPSLSTKVSSFISGSRKIVIDEESTAVKEVPAMPNRKSQVMEKQASSRRAVMSKEKQRPSFLRATGDFLPMISRGLASTEEKDDNVVSVGWKVEVRTRKEREESLRDEVHGFEGKMKIFQHLLEEGVEVMLWQLNRTVDIGAEETDDFAHKSQNVTLQLNRKGDLYVQSDITFTLRGGYLSKAIGRTRGDKTTLEPLSVHDVLEVKAGCAGYDHTELPTASGKTPSSKSKSKSKSKKSSGNSENRQSSLFLTIKATPTPTANSRSYILRFKSRSARNDVMHGMRSVLADMQIKEGVGISGLHFKKEADLEAEKIMVPLSAVNAVINKERQNYDRVILMLWQGFEDLKEKEDELLNLRSKLERVVEESTEKDRVQANDSKLIMQLSKKLETLLMESEDLRDQNDRLNGRLVHFQSDKMNLSSRG